MNARPRSRWDRGRLLSVIALDDARLEAERASALLDVAHELAAASDAAAIAYVVAEALPRIVGCDRSGILLWDPSAGVLRTAAAAGMTDEQTRVLEAASIRPEDAPELVGMLTDPAPLLIHDTTSSPVLGALLQAIGSSDVIAVPLLAGSAFMGVATAGWTKGTAPTSLTGDVLVRLRGLGDQASTALQKARLLETVRHQATHDALTGLPNRVLFLDRLQKALAAVGPDSHVGLLFCDLDRFEQVNDTLGHAAGDELLRQVAARLRAAVRPGDTVGRLSGDEFDKEFLLMMRMHHMSAVDMAELVPTRAIHNELKPLAQNIITSQTAEIAQFEGWLMSWYGIDAMTMEGAMPGEQGGETPGMPSTGMSGESLGTLTLGLIALSVAGLALGFALKQRSRV
mgnify:CR=1 FL=1